jgi:hypothetical protein
MRRAAVSHLPAEPHATVRELLTDYYRRAGLLDPGQRVDARLHDRWIRMRIRGRLIPIKPLLGHQHAILLHDVHHMVSGYGTSFREELQLAAWELGSGGCRWYALFWLNRINAVLLGLLFCPMRTLRALRAGRGLRNLYGCDASEILDLDFAAVRAYVDPYIGSGRTDPDRSR